MLTSNESSTGHTEETRDGQRPHPPSLFSPHSDTTQTSAHRRPWEAPLQVPHTGKRRENATKGSIRLTNRFFRVTLITHSRPQANEDVYHQRQKREKERKAERKDTLHITMLFFMTRHKLTLSLENQCATTKLDVYPRQHNIFINGELSYSNYTKCLSKLILSCNIK